MRVAYFDCQSGASGNMLLGAFLDAGAPIGAVRDAIHGLGLDEAAELKVERRAKGEVDATYVEVEVRHPQPWRRLSEIDGMIAGAALEEGVKERSRLAFRLLGQAEAEAHGVSVDQVTLHETGAVDAVVDVVGTFAAAEAMGVEAFYASALPLSEGGSVESAHGTLPLPAPATMNILAATGAPTYRKEGTAELVTPTGAAIIGACAVFEQPRLTSERHGYGAGTADLPWPNVLRVLVGDLVLDGDAEQVQPQTITVLETNIDDMAPNLLAAVPEGMLAAGALEAFLTPVVMKKGRSAHLLTVICAPEAAEALATRLLTETSTLGVRVREQSRLVAGRRLERLQTSLGEVGVKLKLLGERVVDAVPELDDVRAAATRAGVPLTVAYREVSEAARRQFMRGERRG